MHLNTISIDLASDLASSWQKSRQSSNANGNMLKGFFIPRRDLEQLIGIELLTGKTITGYRGYVGIDSDNNYKLLIVAVDEQEDDILNMDEDPSVSLVFDFTKPCPAHCGHKLNPLNNPPR